MSTKAKGDISRVDKNRSKKDTKNTQVAHNASLRACAQKALGNLAKAQLEVDVNIRD